MHVTCALMGVADEDRCVNWKHGVYKPCEIKSGDGEKTSG